MQIRNSGDVRHWFDVLQTGETSQTAIMVLAPGKASGEKSNEHPGSEQILLVLDGEVTAEIGDERGVMHKGDVVIVPPGAPHKFTNHGKAPAVTFNVYSPPAY